MNLTQFQGSVELGLIFALVSLGVHLSFRVLRFPDLTTDGSFALGAAVSASLILHGVSPFLATLVALFAGAISGYVTALFTTRLKVMNLLAGILTMSALYSVNLRVLGNKPNLSLLGVPTLFTFLQSTGMAGPFSGLILLLFIVVTVTWVLAYFLKSNLGLGMRAAGGNPRMGQAQGVSEARMIQLGLALSNGLIALAGSLFAQVFAFADVTMGVGTIIIGLASVILGEAIVTSPQIGKVLLGCVLGATLYRIVIGFALNANYLGLQASDLNLVTAGLILVFMGVPALRKKT